MKMGKSYPLSENLPRIKATKPILFGLVLAVLFTVTLFITFGPHAHAFGGKRKKIANQEPADTLAYPTRIVSLGEFYKSSFTLPDGKTKVDTAALLPEMVVTEIGSITSKLRTRPLGIPERGRFVLRGGVTAFEADIVEFGIKFGYRNSAGDLLTGNLNATAEVRVKIGQLDMDFHIIDTLRNETVGVGHADTNSANVSFDGTVNFGDFKTGADFFWHSPIADVFRRVIDAAILNMMNNPNTNKLMDWSRSIVSRDMDLRRVIFDAGFRDDIAVNNIFDVYDNSSKLIGTIKVRSVELEKSSASFKDDGNDKLLRSVNSGDSVVIDFKVQK